MLSFKAARWASYSGSIPPSLNAALSPTITSRRDRTRLAFLPDVGPRRRTPGFYALGSVRGIQGLRSDADPRRPLGGVLRLGWPEPRLDAQAGPCGPHAAAWRRLKGADRAEVDDEAGRKGVGTRRDSAGPMGTRWRTADSPAGRASPRPVRALSKHAGQYGRRRTCR